MRKVRRCVVSLGIYTTAVARIRFLALEIDLQDLFIKIISVYSLVIFELLQAHGIISVRISLLVSTVHLFSE